MNELSLFSGAGGGILGSKILGWRTVGYVEYDSYCQESLKQRIQDGILDAAPIFGDIRAFVRDGYAAMYKGMVDMLTGGFPCQPFSVAGKQLAEADPRNMWPETIACIRLVKPRYALLENVPGLLQKPYFRRILREIAESRYDCRWGVLGASDVGANHRRKRLWILAYPKHGGLPERRGIATTGEENNGLSGISGDDAAARCVEERQVLADSERVWELQPQGTQQNEWGRPGDRSKDVANPDSPGFQGEGEKSGSQEAYPRVEPCSNAGVWWDTEPNVGRVAHGVASRVDRLKAIGNGQVPLCMAYAFSVLSRGIIGEEVADGIPIHR